jgi:hypothetical protein
MSKREKVRRGVDCDRINYQMESEMKYIFALAIASYFLKTRDLIHSIDVKLLG